MVQLKEENKKVIDVELHKELQSSFIDYAVSVIISRALPDVRDGFKPSQRRIIVAMDRQGLSYNKAYRKSAKVVGEVMANYHPHGDMAIYQTMVNLAQPFNKRYPLLDGQGNWGSIDGDSAAAMRYTEVRMKKICNEVLEDIDKNTVCMVPNFDETLEEPVVLPTKIPNLLINGSSGIAVGMATYIPPHNLNEVMDAIIEVLKNRDISDEVLFDIVKGPDFPLGAIICGDKGIKKAYREGKGSFIVRGVIEKEIIDNVVLLVIKEIPYQVIKADLVAKIAQLAREKVIEGVSKVRDESNKKGIRVVIELKRDTCSDTITNLLYKYTSLQISLHISLLALKNNKPVLFSLRSIIDSFIDHRREVIYNRTQFDKNKAEKQKHILLGIKKIVSDLDNAINYIKNSKNTEDAERILIETYGLSFEQVRAVLDLKLSRLTSIGRDEIDSDLIRLEGQINEYNLLLNSANLIDKKIIDESYEVKSLYGDSRRTVINSDYTDIADPSDFIADDEVVVTLTKNGYIKRVHLEIYNLQHRGGKGKKGMDDLDQYDDLMQDVFLAKNHDEILFFTNFGRVYSSFVYQIPEASRIAKGRAIINLIPMLQENEKVIKLMSSRDMKNKYLMLITKKGLVKKTESNAFLNIRQSGIRAVILNDFDELVFCMLTNGTNSVMLATKLGMAIRFYENEVRPTGRNSAGVRGILLRKNDEIVGALVIYEDQSILFVTEYGYGKKVDISKFRTTHRGGVGVKTIPTNDRNGVVIGMTMVSINSDILLIDQNGKIIRISSTEIRVMGRQAQGLRLIRLNDNQKVSCVATFNTEISEINNDKNILEENPTISLDSKNKVDSEFNNDLNLDVNEDEEFVDDTFSSELSTEDE